MKIKSLLAMGLLVALTGMISGCGHHNNSHDHPQSGWLEESP